MNRGISRHVLPIEVDDPYELGAKIITMRSVKNDPLANLHARGAIDDAHYQAGRAFQHDFEAAERGPRAIDPSKEAVDGGLMPEPITEAQQKAAKSLAGAVRTLGQDGSAIIHYVLIHGMTMEQVAGQWRRAAEPDLKYLGRRLKECLDCLAVFYGFAQERRRHGESIRGGSQCGG